MPTRPSKAPSESSSQASRSTAHSRKSLRHRDLLSPTKTRASSIVSLTSGSATIRPGLKTSAKIKGVIGQPSLSSTSNRIPVSTRSIASRRTSAPVQIFPQLDPALSTLSRPFRQNTSPSNPSSAVGSPLPARSISMHSPNVTKLVPETTASVLTVSSSRSPVVSMTPPRRPPFPQSAQATPTPIRKSPSVSYMLSPSSPAIGLASSSPKLKSKRSLLGVGTATPQNPSQMTKKHDTSLGNTPSKTPMSTEKSKRNISDPVVTHSGGSMIEGLSLHTLDEALSVWDGEDMSVDLITDVNEGDIDEEVRSLTEPFSTL